MARDDWYRNTSWNSKIERKFFEKLSRARSQRDQYIAIQTITLARHKPQQALKLAEFYFDTRTNCFDDVRVLLAEAKAHEALGNTELLVQTYRRILNLEAEFPNHLTPACVDYPYLVATQELVNEYDYALQVLNERDDKSAFPVATFKRHAAYALIGMARGNTKEARAHAREAAAAAEARKSGFRYHQNLGLVGKEYKPVVKMMLQMDRGTEEN